MPAPRDRMPCPTRPPAAGLPARNPASPPPAPPRSAWGVGAAGVFGVVLFLLAALGGSHAASPSTPWAWPLQADTVRADTLLSDTLRADTLLADTLRQTPAGADTLGGLLPDTLRAEAPARDTSLVARLLPPFQRDPLTASLRPRRRPLTPDLGGFWDRSVEFDAERGLYTVRERVGGEDVRVPTTLGLDAYRDARLRLAVDDNFRDLARQRVQRQQRRAGVGVGFEIPGGAGRGLRTIFGSDQVDLRVNGQANVNVGFAYRQNEQQQAATGQGTRVDPDFGQELGLSILGTIGDKLEVNVNYDTQNDFDFQNQVRLVYTGYEDEIVRRIEAGNVFLPVESDLIRGGQRLFGLKTDLQIGGLAVTAVASQQDAESDELVITGGSQTTPFSVLPAAYENAAHFYLGYYFYNRWDVAHSSPPIPLAGAVNTVEDIEVYKFDISLTSPDLSDDLIAGVALVDLGEPAGVLQGGRAYLAQAGTSPPAPDPTADRYPEAALNALRTGGYTGDLAARQRLAGAGVDVSSLRDQDLVVSRFKRLRRGQDFEFDQTFGYVSLNQPLNESDVLAVAYRYRRQDGTLVTVGDLGQGTGSGNVDEGPRIVLKLLRPGNLQPTDAAWDLTMRNIYRIGGRGLDAEGFELHVLYAGTGQTPQRTLPGVTIGQQQALLQTLGLDRLNQDGQRGSDDLFDFLPGFTINRGTGRIIFPFREPFGSRIRRVLQGEVAEAPVAFDGISVQEAVDRYVFEALYTQKQEVAQRQTDKNVYRIAGSSRGTVQEFYDLGFAIVAGSVEVRSGELRLNEGVDYTVDYTSGSVSITNPAFLTPGRDIRIGYERQQFIAIQKKTLLGLRAQYEFTDRLAVGATWMRLAERPLIDKYRVGEEPISNSIWGLDARYEAEPQWITRVLDALPLIQTRAPSRFEFRGEFAQLDPGHPETIAFGRSRDRALALESPNARDLKPDELDGVSFIDDFEGSENTFSLLQPGAWRLASGPTGDATRNVPGAGPDSVRTYLDDLIGPRVVTRPALRSNWRGLFGWYAVTQGAYESGALRGLPATGASRPIPIREVFPERQVQRNTPAVLTTLDVYFDPSRRGPYNFNAELGGAYAQNPTEVWGGMMQRIPDGYRDFEARNNIEFVEFIFSPFGGRMADEPLDPTGTLYIDLGRVSEDVLPDGELNTEDGMLVPGSVSVWGRRGTGPTDGIVNVNPTTLRTENLGLNGLPSGVTAQRAAEAGSPYDLTEEQHYAAFLDALRQSLPPNDPRLLRAEQDPAADDFRSFQDEAYFNDPALWPGGAVLQERFSQFFAGFELNSLEAQNLIAQRRTPGISRTPNTEDLNLDGSLNTVEALYRYAIPLDPTRLRQSPFYVEEIYNPDVEGAATWYVVRIPVRSEDREAIGAIDGFREVDAIRVWTDGHARPVTMRFAKLELVGSQWLQARELARPGVDAGETLAPDPAVFVATVNTEENPTRYRVPNGTIRSFTRDPTTGELLQNREQSIVLQAENLAPGARAAIFRPYTRSLDLTKYRNLRMFVHGSGFEQRDSLRVFVRLGANEAEDYYEIEQPLYPWSPPNDLTVSAYEDLLSGGAITNAVATTVADSLWQTNVPISDGQGGTRYVDRNAINVAFAALNILKVERDLARDPEDNAAPWPVSRAYAKPVSDFAPTDVGDFAPPGAVLRIRGTPTIQNITSIVMGVRRVGGAAPAANAEVWFNELRVSGYDEEAGWSAYARASLRLADVADISGRYARQTDAFGELASGLGNRSFRDDESYQLTANINLHRALPERYGWQMPLNVTVQQRTATPRFSPRRGDITVDQEIEQIRANPDLTDAEREREIATVRAAAETASYSRTIRVPLSKTGSRSPWLRYTLDGLALTYTNTLEERRSPLRALEDSERWTSALSYRLAVPRPRTVRPFWLVEDVPVLGVLSGLRVNVLPQSVRLSADATRSVFENQDRRQRGLSQDPLRRALEVAAEDNLNIGQFLQPVNRRHTFGHNRGVEVQYAPLGFLSLGYGSRVRQSLDAAGVDSSLVRLVQRVDQPGTFAVYEAATFQSLFETRLEGDQIVPVGPGFARLGITAGDQDLLQQFAQNPAAVVRDYPVAGVRVRPVASVIGDALTGERPVLTDTYQQTMTGSLQSPFERVQALNWLRISPVTYSSSFNWGYVPLTQFGIGGQDRVASLSSQGSVRGGISFRLRDLAQKIGPLKSLDAAQREADQEARRRQQAFQTELTAYRRAGERVRQAATALREAEQAAEAAGEPLDEARAGALRTALEQAVAADTLARPSPPFPLPNPLDLGRRTLLAVTTPRDLSFTYDGSFSAAIGNARNPGYSLLSALTGDGPSLGFRLGLDRRYPASLGTRFVGSADAPVTFSDAFRDEHRLGARTSLEFSPALRMDLTWDVNLRENETVSYTTDDAFSLLTPSFTRDGSGQATVWALGGGYDALFERHLTRLRDVVRDAEAGATVPTDALTNNAVVEDFRRSFLTDLGSFGTNGFFALPLPNWQVTYSGLANWPVVRTLAQSASLRHGYSATFDTQFRSFPASVDQRQFALPGGPSFTLLSQDASDRRAESARINRRFQPLVGVDMNLRLGVQANVNWNTSTTYALSAANAFVNQSETEELALRLSFAQSGFRLPIPFARARRLANQFRFSLVVAQANNLQRRYTLRDDLQAALANERPGLGTPLPETFRNPPAEASRRLTMEPQIAYTLSNAVTASFFLRYERFEAENSRIPTTTNLNGGFNFRVSFSN
jgi:cell surface protein SprA